VILFERDRIAGHASGSNAGKLNPLLGASPELAPLALDAFEIHAAVRASLTELGCDDFDLRPLVRLHLGDAADRAELSEIAAIHNSAPGFSARWLDRDELARLEPRLSSGPTAGVITEGAFSVDGEAFTRSLAQGAGRLGAKFETQAVTGLETRGDRVEAVRTGAGAIACDAVVVATGPWIDGPGAWLGIRVAVEAWRGDLVILRLGGSPPAFDLTWRETSIYHWRDGLVAVGMMHRDIGNQSHSEVEARFRLAASAILPAIDEATLVDHRSAHRPRTEANMPIAAAAPGWRNAFVANGGGGKGVLLSALIARRVRLLVSGDSDDALGSHLLN
jgi:glycine/D-amino acid oxidase-like deaminating enzyme